MPSHLPKSVALKCSISPYNEVQYSALIFYFHWLYRHCSVIFVIHFLCIGSGFKSSQGSRTVKHTFVTDRGVLDTVELDVAQLVSGRSNSNHEGAQSSSGPEGLASNSSSSSHTKSGCGVHLTAPKGNHHIH